MQLVHDLQEMPRAPGHPVERRDENDVEFVLPGVLHHRVQSRTPGFGSGHSNIDMLGYDFIPALFSELPEIAQLGFNVLFWR
jgi:hypothetical protein